MTNLLTGHEDFIVSHTRKEAMTDEEKAYKAICDSIPCKTMCTKCKCYIAGFKAGRETEREYVRNNAFTSMKEQRLFPFGKWHKVADGDLPKENKLYLVQIKDNGLAIAYFNGRHWETRYNLGEPGHCVETVIAWREIPTFEE